MRWLYNISPDMHLMHCIRINSITENSITVSLLEYITPSTPTTPVMLSISTVPLSYTADPI